MTLERATVTLRRRSAAELRALAVLLARRHAGAVALALLPGALLASAVNAAILAAEWPGPFLAWAVALEAPLVAAPVTLVAGQAVFSRRLSVRSALLEALRRGPALLGLALWTRGVLYPTLVLIPWVEAAYRPLREALLLQPGPREDAVRSARALRRGRGGLLLGRWLGDVGAAALGAAILASGLRALRALATGGTPPAGLDAWLRTPELHIASWLVVGWLGVLAALGYLDLKLRHEGWELELALRDATRRVTASAPGR